MYSTLDILECQLDAYEFGSHWLQTGCIAQFDVSNS